MQNIFSKLVLIERFRGPFVVFIFVISCGMTYFSVASDDFSGKNIFLDADQDGLTDDEEVLYGTDSRNRDSDGDGYSDGAEVRSGYDPRKSAPGDKIIVPIQDDEESKAKSDVDISNEFSSEGLPLSELRKSDAQNVGGTDDMNLTSQVSEEIANILKQSSNEDKDASSSAESIQEQISSLLESQNTQIDDTLPEVNIDDIKVKKQDYDGLSKEDRDVKIKQDTLEYVTKVSYIIASHSALSVSDPKDVGSLMETMMSKAISSIEGGDSAYLEDLVKKGEQALSELQEIEVPKNMLDAHVKAIQLFLYASEFPSELKSFDDDPLANVVVLSRMQGFLATVLGFVKEIDASMKGIGIEEIPVDL